MFDHFSSYINTNQKIKISELSLKFHRIYGILTEILL